MGSSAELLEELLDDAKLVAAYGQRTGRLKDASLIQAIAAVETLQQRDWANKPVVQLQLALNRAIQAIAPTTLIELKSGWTPFNPAEGSKPRANIAFVVFTLLMMVAAAWYTLQYNIGAAVIAELEKIGTENVEQEIGRILRKLIASDQKILEVARNDASGDAELYFSLVDTLREYDSRITKYQSTANEFLRKSDQPVAILYTALRPYIFPVSTGANLPQYDCRNAQHFPPAPVTALNVAPRQALATTPSETSTVSTPQPVPADGTVFTSSNFQVVYADYYKEALDILCRIDVRTTPFDIPPVEELTSRSRDRVNLLALWFLPSVYGGLGATIYYMRRILDPTLIDPKFYRILHRIALGAFSGVILAWFWTPQNKIEGDFGNIGLNLFGAAFLIGFSVEIFFTFLDRIVFLAINWIKQIGLKGATTPPTA